MVNIHISDGLWRYLNSQKKVGESFEEVLQRILKGDKAVSKTGGSYSNSKQGVKQLQGETEKSK